MTETPSTVCRTCEIKDVSLVDLNIQTQQSSVVTGNIVGHINEVNLRQARLVLGWVTVYGPVNHLGM